MGTPLGPKYIPYTYMDPLGLIVQGSSNYPPARDLEAQEEHATQKAGEL